MLLFIFLGIVMLAGVVYLAVSKQSSFKIRVAALIALALMVITVIICMVLIMTPKTLETEGLIPFMEASAPAPPPKSNPSVLIGFILLLITLFAGVLYLSLRDQKKSGNKADGWD